jgi:hypothetical protein
MSITGGATITGNVALYGNITVNGSALVGSVTTAANTFIGLQTMNAGITSNHLYVSNGATFTGIVSTNISLKNNNNTIVNMSSNARSWFL